MDFCQDRLCKDCDCICNNYTRNGGCVKLEDPEAEMKCQECGKPLSGRRRKRHSKGNLKWIESDTFFDDTTVIDFGKGIGINMSYPVCEECLDFRGGFI